MKFKIRKEQAEVFASMFKKDPYITQEIDLELVPDTATEAVIHQQIETMAYHKGYHRGFKEGYYEGNKTENKWRCKCGCGGNNCQFRFCDDKRPLLNI